MEIMEILAIAGLIAAVAVAFLAVLAAVQVMRLGSAIDELRDTVKVVRGHVDQAGPAVHTLLQQAQSVVSEVDTTVVDVRDQMAKVDTITTNATAVSANLSTVSNLITLSVAVPIVKVAALGHGLRETMSARRALDSRRLNRRRSS